MSVLKTSCCVDVRGILCARFARGERSYNVCAWREAPTEMLPRDNDAAQQIHDVGVRLFVFIFMYFGKGRIEIQKTGIECIEKANLVFSRSREKANIVFSHSCVLFLL